jgi:hypothetical protein
MKLHRFVAFETFAVRRVCATFASLVVGTMWLNNFAAAQDSSKSASNAVIAASEKNATSSQAKKQQSSAVKPAAKATTPRVNTAELIEARRNAAKQAARNDTSSNAPAPYAETYTPAYAPLGVNANASLRAQASSIQLANVVPRAVWAGDAFAKNQSTYSVVLTPTSIDAHVLRNIYEPLGAPMIEVGDRPARGTSLCSEARTRRFGDIDMKAFAQTLPDFNVARPRTVCLRRGVLMADYFFK